MGIDTHVGKFLKGVAPEAFSPNPPFKTVLVNIDGMTCLMKGAHVTHWSELIQRNFLYKIERYLRQGVKVVVLSFDVYTLVSPAKAITQCKRNTNVKIPHVPNSSEFLPEIVPATYNDDLRNREFKLRVIDLIISRLPDLLKVNPNP
jgi:hypothetical protein